MLRKILLEFGMCWIYLFLFILLLAVLPFYLTGFSGHRSALTDLLYVIGQPKVCDWMDLPSDLFYSPRKLGEGVYGEVFGTLFDGNLTALKIIPFNGDVVTYDGKVNGELLVDAEGILPEILINRELSSLCDPVANFTTPNFIRLLKAYVVRGSYPVEFLSAWDEYSIKMGSENDRPSEYDGPNQLFLIMGMAMGGVDLESYQLHNENEVISIMLQLALSLLVAEEMIQFEHRDLHIGNVLAMESNEDIEYRYAGKDIILRSYGCKISIIDFTLSRMTKGGTTIFRDLEPDEELFQGKDDYQFDIYRMMRAHNGGDWQSFSPKTNCMWLHYMSRQLIGVRKCKKAITKRRKLALQKVFDRLLNFESLRSIFTDDEFYGILQKHLVMNTKTMK